MAVFDMCMALVASHPLGGLVDQAGGVYSCCYSPGRRRRDPRRKSSVVERKFVSEKHFLPELKTVEVNGKCRRTTIKVLRFII